MSEFTETLT